MCIFLCLVCVVGLHLLDSECIFADLYIFVVALYSSCVAINLHGFVVVVHHSVLMVTVQGTVHHRGFFYRPDALPVTHPTVSRNWKQIQCSPWMRVCEYSSKSSITVSVLHITDVTESTSHDHQASNQGWVDSGQVRSRSELWHGFESVIYPWKMQLIVFDVCQQRHTAAVVNKFHFIRFWLMPSLFVQTLESSWIQNWNFPGLESPRKRPWFWKTPGNGM